MPSTSSSTLAEYLLTSNGFSADSEVQQALQRGAQIQLSRESSFAFSQTVLKNENNQLVIPSAIHQSWHEHIEYARKRNKHACIIAPWGHGKSTQLVIGRVLWELGRNPNIRIKIVCNSDENAVARVKAITRYIQEDEDFRAVFPNCKSDQKEQWNQHRFFLKRNSRSIDPSCEAKGILTTGIGGRCDGLIFDDPVDLRNAVDNPALQPKVIENFSNVWMSRLEPKGWMAYIATRWTEGDLTSVLLNDPERAESYTFLIQKISEDFKFIESERIG